MSEHRTVTHHLLRRRARLVAHRLNQAVYKGENRHYTVEKASRGPWRWRVIEVRT